MNYEQKSRDRSEAPACSGCNVALTYENSWLLDDGRPGRMQYAGGKGFLVCTVCGYKTPVAVHCRDITKEVEGVLRAVGLKVAPRSNAGHES